MTSLPKSSRLGTQLVFEILLALNLGLATRMLLAYANYFSTEEHLKGWLNQKLHLHPHAELGGNAAFLILSIEVSFILFLIIISVSRLHSIRTPIQTIGGILSIIALPFCYIYRVRLYARVVGEPSASYPLLAAELLIVTLIVLSYGISRYSLPLWFVWTAILLHFCLWDWLFLGAGYFWRASFHLLFPVIALLSALTWAYRTRTLQSLEGKSLRGL